MSEQQTLDTLISWVQGTVPKDIDLLVPISGGTDSALCFFICSQAVPEKTCAVYAGQELPYREWFERIGSVQHLSIDTPKTALGWQVEIERWAAFMSMAINENRMLVGSRNRTEQILGTYSMASRVAWFYPVIGLWKNDVMRLCEYIGVPENVISSSSQADPACGRPQALAQIPHMLVDAFAKQRLRNNSPDVGDLEQGQTEYLEKIYTRNMFKQQLPHEGPMIELSATS